uniref:Uncharacterized protein n=1 Tax=Helianthus annuus TaxID=4232 RepID=A0A251VQI0_HELAN
MMPMKMMTMKMVTIHLVVLVILIMHQILVMIVETTINMKARRRRKCPLTAVM